MGGVVDFFAEDVLGLGGGGRDAEKTLREADQIYKDIPEPTYEQLKVNLEQMVSAGELRPEEASAILQDKSRLSNYVADPRLRESQLRALGALQEIGNEGGLTATDRARLADIEQDEARAARGARGAILQNAQERGVGGSGLELVNQLLNQQESSNRASRRGMDVASMAEQRALDALMKSGQLSGDIRGQDFGEQEQIAAAEDAINRFNAANRQDVLNRNIEARNKAQEANLRERQRLSDSNTNIRNLNRQNKADVWQNLYENKLRKAAGRTGTLSGIAGAQMDAGRSRDQFLGQLIASGAQMAGAAGGGAAMFSDENVKENVEPGMDDVKKFMDEIGVHKFDYKDPEKYGEGKHYGPMAQELEESPVGKSMVEEDGEGVKRVNYGKSQAVMLSVLKDLYDRVGRLENAG